MESVISSLSQSLADWEGNASPVEKGEWVVLSGLDSNADDSSISDLFFADLPGHAHRFDGGFSDLDCYSQVNSGTLRNSFYPELFLQHSAINKLALRMSVKGPLALQVGVSRQGEPVKLLVEKDLLPEVDQAAQVREVEIPINFRNVVGESSRLFWVARALADGVDLHNAAWGTYAPKKVGAKMMVALRTFGRTQDILTLIEQFQDSASKSGQSHYARMLQNTFFLILDTSAGLEDDDYDLLKGLPDIQFHVIKGANLGGGGNMSQIMRLLSAASQGSGVEPDELLLLDDDLHLSMESLYRHWASTLFRTDKTIFTLPVFTKSDPRKMWEDGAFWGRFLDAEKRSRRTNLAPRLLRHNLNFKLFDHLDMLATPNYPEYCTFIFFSLPWSLFGQLGYPLAIFLRGDDIEYSLRSKAKAGARILSNPNLAAWHEPAHSYGQEYMSIAHGIIINMIYGHSKPEALIRYFQQQALRHLSLNDYRGLQLYIDVLNDLLSKVIFLENGFAVHYVEKLKYFKSFDAEFEHVPHEILADKRHAMAGGSKHMVEHPFLYMPVESRNTIGTVMLHNHHSKTVKLYNFEDPQVQEQASRTAAELFGLIARIPTEFRALREHYVSRVKESSTAEYWDRELALHDAPATIAQSLQREAVDA